MGVEIKDTDIVISSRGDHFVGFFSKVEHTELDIKLFDHFNLKLDIFFIFVFHIVIILAAIEKLDIFIVVNYQILEILELSFDILI